MTKLPVERWHVLGYRPNAWALDHIHGQTARFTAGVTARQVGKSITAAMEIDLAMTEPKDVLGRPPSVGVLAPTYEKAELVIRKYIDAINRAFGEDYFGANMNQHRLWLPHNGAELVWLSSDDPYGVVGYTLSHLVVDEAQAVPDIVWEKIRPTLDVRMAKVVAFGTPDITPEQTWFRGLWLRGQDPDDANYHSFTLSALQNRWMSAEAIAEARATLPERTFRMLYMGEWVDAGGSVFPGIESALLAEEPKLERGHRYLMAIDFAIHEDFNVVLIGDPATRTVVHMERWSQTDPLTTYERIADISEKWGNTPAIVDATGLGEPMAWELRDRGIRTRMFKITAANKMAMIGRLAGDIEHRRIMFPNWKALITELKAFTYRTTPGGRLSAEAASGFHDDCVTALALLNEGFRQRSGTNAEQYNYLSAQASRRKWL